MSMGAREEPFAAFVDAYRERLIGTAALIHLIPDRAPGLVDAALARVYVAWPRLDDPYGTALRSILDPGHLPLADRARGASTFELVDVAHSEIRPTDDIWSELAALTADERRILVLACFTRLPAAQIARVLDRPLDDVVAQLAAATRQLAGSSSGGPRRLAAELTAAVHATSTSAAAAAGPRLLRRRRLQIAAVAAALLVLATFGIRQAIPPPAPVAAAGPAASTTPAAPCDTTQAACRADIVSAWRGEMADVISEYLDPKGEYFTGYSYSYTEDYLGSGFFDGAGGALALDLYRMREGATEVRLQIATGRQYAMRCGQLTGRSCQSVRFMDGNRFLLTDPYDVAHGLEAQHRPEGSYVITLVARNTSKAKTELPVTRADLITVISDPRLRLPPR